VLELLKFLSLRGTIVTTDALNRRQDIARQIVENGGDSALAFKGNRRALRADISLLPEHLRWDRGESIRPRTATMAASRRTSRICTEVAAIQKRHRWPGLAAIGKVVRTRDTASTATTETAYYLLSAALSPNDLAKSLVRIGVSKTGFTGFSMPSWTRTGREIVTITAHTTSPSCATWRST
jgi:hypothetical protein